MDTDMPGEAHGAAGAAAVGPAAAAEPLLSDDSRADDLPVVRRGRQEGGAGRGKGKDKGKGKGDRLQDHDTAETRERVAALRSYLGLPVDWDAIPHSPVELRVVLEDLSRRVLEQRGQG